MVRTGIQTASGPGRKPETDEKTICLKNRQGSLKQGSLFLFCLICARDTIDFPLFTAYNKDINIIVSKPYTEEELSCRQKNSKRK